MKFVKQNALEKGFFIFKQMIKRFHWRWLHNAVAETAALWCEAFVALANLKVA